MKCTKCQFKNPDDTSYCGKCGTRLPSSEKITISQTETLEISKEELITGTIFARRYKVIEKLGKGGMGKVYKAVDSKIDEEVALKFLKPEIAADEKMISRFKNELKYARKISHKNVCRMYHLSEEAGAHYITMEYVPGEDLKSFIRRSGQLTAGKAIFIASQICEGLVEAHKLGVVHRDIKPQNIMIDRDGNARIMDFGIARSFKAKDLTETGMIIGTPEYISPEQVEGEEGDQRSDIYSLGIVFYEMVTGKAPFGGGTPLSIAFKHKTERAINPREVNPQISKNISQVILKCMEKDKEKRYQKAEELLSELRQIEQGIATPESVIHKRKPTLGTPRKRLKPFAVPGALIFAAIVIVAGYFFFGKLFKLEKPTIDNLGKPKLTRAIPFSERDWILITDFDNLTDDEVFNNSLNTALSAAIGQSRFINVISGRTIEEALSRMKKKNVDLIDESTGREIALREGINILVLPTISQVGSTYALTCVIQEAFSGKTFRTEVVHAKSKDDVLSALDELAKNIRRDLGEALTSISRQSKPLVATTTSSLEALKQYSLGIEKIGAANFVEAKVYWESTLRIDPSFTAAKASLGQLYFEKFDRERGKMLLEDAINELDNLTEKEKYSILAFYAAAVENDLEKAIDYCKTKLALYPDDSAAHNNLGWYFQQMERIEDAISEYKEAIKIDPYLMLAYNGLINIYLYQLGKVDSAILWCKRQLSYNKDHVWPYNNLGWAYIGKGKLKKAQDAFEKALEIDPEFIVVLNRLSHTYRLQKHYSEALKPLKEIFKLNPEESWVHYQMGTIYQLMGNNKSATQHFEYFLKDVEKWVSENPNDAYNYITLGLVFTRLGQKKRGWATGQKAMALDSSQYFGFAQLLSLQGKKQEAINQLELAIQEGFHSYIWMKIHPDLQPLYLEPRFKKLIRRTLKK